MYFIRLIRPVNLLIIVFTMVVMRYAVIGKSVLDSPQSFDQWPFAVSDPDFFLLVFSTILIAAAGYIINDYFDMRIDRINKPEKVIVGKHIKKRSAMLLHVVFNIAAVLIAGYLTFKYRNIYPLIVHLFTTFTLWMYSLMLKRQFLTGNIAISILAALVVLLTGWMDIPELKEVYMHRVFSYPFSSKSIEAAVNTIWIYAGFAFLGTLIREIQKDLADVKGDAVQKCSTVPLVLGIAKTKQLVLFLLFVLISLVALVQVVLLDDTVSTYFITGLVITPMLISAGFCFYATDRKYFLLASASMKAAMFTGVLYAFFIP